LSGRRALHWESSRKEKTVTSRIAKSCAYCDGTERPLTREHIWGETFHDRHPPHTNFSAKVPEEGVKSDPVIKDVCDKCNNEKLSPLDAFGIGITEKYFIPSGDGVKPPVHFDYGSFDMFSRWLLKLLYNDARACNQQVEEHAAFRRYILGEAESPHNFNIFGVLLRPARVPKELVAEVGTDTIYPRDNTMAILVPPEQTGDRWKLGRMIRFRAFIFFVIVWNDEVDLRARRETQQAVVGQYQCTHVHPGRSYVDLHYTNINTMRFLFDSHQNDFESVKTLPLEPSNV